MPSLVGVIRTVARNYSRQMGVNRTMLMTYSSQMNQTATGQVVSLNETRRSATLLLPDGSAQEHFLQNRYVQKRSAVGAIGQRVL